MDVYLITILHEHGYENVIGFNSADLIERNPQPLSFIKLKVETKDNKDCANEISKKIRKYVAKI